MYGMSGVLLLLFLIIIFFTYVSRLKVETAVVSALIETISAPVGGYITDVFVEPGEIVKKGRPLFTIQHLELDRELQLARVQVEESELLIDYYQQLLINEQKRLKLYQKIGDTRVISAQTLVNQSKQDVLIAQRTADRYTELHKKNYVSDANLEDVLSKSLNTQEALKYAKAQRNLERDSLDALDQGMYFTGTKTEGIEKDLIAELDSAKKKTILNKKRVEVYEAIISKLTMKAPFDGKIIKILKSPGNTTDAIKPIIFIEKTKKNKTILAYLTQDEVIRIGSSKDVKIYIPSSGRKYHGTVLQIDRTEGFIDLVNVQYRWRDFTIDRSAIVTIAIKACDREKFNSDAFSGMPAIAYFSKYWL